MDNIDKLIQKIDEEIAREKAILSVLELISKNQEKGQEFRIIKRSIVYREMFRENILGMKEEM